MQRRMFVAAAAAIGAVMIMPARLSAEAEDGTPVASASAGERNVINSVVRTGYAPVNGLKMYYEIHGGTPPSSFMG